MSTSSRLAHNAASSFFSSLDCPRSLTAYILLNSGEYEQLVNLSFNPLDYNDVAAAANALAATKYLSKAEFLKIDSIDRKEVALDGFRRSEQACAYTNRNLSSAVKKNNRLATVIAIAARKIELILGPICAEEILENCNWGPGATYALKRSDATASNKFRCESGITPTALSFWRDMFRLAYPSWVVTFEPCQGNRVVTVPKNAKTDRTIAIEPGLNIWIQKGIGAVIRQRLHRWGIDLNDQRRNQKLSRIGSKFNTLTTVDFSAASDTISRAVVELLLPRDWFLALDSCRSKYGRLSDGWLEYEKFSSMGNGFTFELESLIFLALALASCEYLNESTSSVSVYGDDVILPTPAYELYQYVSSACGFTVNSEKSYADSYYRESCGKHYWNGKDISPIFLRKGLNGRSEIFKCHNNVRRYAHRRNSYGCDLRFRQTCDYLVGLVPKGARFAVPDGFGDGGFVCNFDEATPVKARHGYEGFYTHHQTELPDRVSSDDYAFLLFQLRRMGVNDTVRAINSSSSLVELGNYELVAPRVKRFVKKRLYVPQWGDLGPWIN